MKEVFDLAIIGGGINGCGIARDAAGRGLAVYLCEQTDLASGTSSASTKLIHGGLRYLEHFEFRLVREALAERETLWQAAPHIVRPLRFVLPHRRGLRPGWMIRAGLFIYDHLGGRRLLPPTRDLDLAADEAGKPLRPGEYRRGFEYSDCWVDDARLVVLNAVDAAKRGAVIRTRTMAISAERGADLWRLTVRDARSGATDTIAAKILINAAGPWIGKASSLIRAHERLAKVRLVRGSHIVVPKLYDNDRCYVLQNADRRIVFVIPYERNFTLIGTTDSDHAGDPADAAATPEEIDYLCATVSAYFAKAISPADVVWSYSGVRPLRDDGRSAAQDATRDYELDLDEGGAPLLSVLGGKITTYRRLALSALETLDAHLPAGARAMGDWTSRERLPGGDFPVRGFDTLRADLARQYPWLDGETLLRLARAYGTRARIVLGKATGKAALGRDFGAGLTEAEVIYLIEEEWAEDVEDILWRRSKLGLHLLPAQVEELRRFVTDQVSGVVRLAT